MASIEKRGTNSWRLIVEAGYDAQGKRIKRSKTIKIEDEALLRTTKKLRDFLNEELVKFKIEVEAGEYIAPEKMKFEAFVEEWRTKYADKKLSPKTLINYTDHLKTRILPAFGHMRIDQIKPLQIATFLKELEKPGARKDGRGEYLDIGTIQYVYRVLKNVFNAACEFKLLPENPMSGIKKPTEDNQSRKKKLIETRLNPQYFNEEEAQAVVDALYKESRKWRLLILGSMIGGCRRGELVGLEWPYVSFEDDSISIENNIPLTEAGQAIEKDPKSLSLIRTIDMPSWYMEELENYYTEWQRERTFRRQVAGRGTTIRLSQWGR